MKKLSAMVMAGVMALGMVGCGSTAAEAPAESTVPAAESTAAETTESTAEAQTETADAQTEAGRQFVVGFDAEFPPYGYKDDSGEYVGFDLDLAQEVCDRLGWTLVKQPIDWDAKDMELEAGTIDCIWNGFTMNGREDQYTWTDPYMDNSQVVVVKKDSGINTLADLAGKVVEVQKESAAETALNDEEHADLMASFAQLLSVGEYNTAFMDLESGAVDAVAIDIGVAQFQIEGKEDQYQILDETISSEQYAVGFFLGNTALRDEVQSTLLEMVEDGTFAEISNQYFGYDVCTLGK